MGNQTNIETKASDGGERRLLAAKINGRKPSFLQEWVLKYISDNSHEGVFYLMHLVDKFQAPLSHFDTLSKYRNFINNLENRGMIKIEREFFCRLSAESKKYLETISPKKYYELFWKRD
ncbi:hypothetical protein [Flavobacterium sp.]|uniref:hypothetical protein n=1 Tax=Flavobacterium sp. TaxID=239 RepID=UPI0012290222|nr:hypothetical protein [Flavobacterium sp.]RZJ71099.1 MAG: hypothetical protein EOO49_11650 [Flavobacterium sp.]